MSPKLHQPKELTANYDYSHKTTADGIEIGFSYRVCTQLSVRENRIVRSNICIFISIRASIVGAAE
jgi:hypothetical protein